MTLQTGREKAFIFLDHDMTIRHFVMSNSFVDLEKNFDVTYIVNIDTHPTAQWVNVDLENLGLRRLIVMSIPRKRMGSWYNLYAPCVLANQRGTSNYEGRRKQIDEVNGRWRRRIFEFYSMPLILPLYRRHFLSRMGEWAPLRDLLQNEKPDILIYPTTLTGYFMNELLVLAPRLNIPFVALMNSWDNPSQKATVTGNPDRLVVWGEHTKRHAIRFMRMPADRIEIFGAAQFQIYRKPVVESDAELRTLFGLPIDDVPVILYAGVSKSINETRHLSLLEDAIQSGRTPPCHILYRPHPWRGGLVSGERNFFEMRYRHIFMDPSMEGYYRRITKQADNAFNMADYEITRKLMHLVTGSISTLSTIQLETVLVGKPTISFVPRTELDSRYGRNMLESQKLAHFQDLWTTPGVTLCDDEAKLPEALSCLLAQASDSDLSRRIRNEGRTFALLEGPTYSERLADLAIRLTSVQN